MSARINKYFEDLFTIKTFNAFDYFLILSIITISITSSVMRGRFDAVGSVSAICGVFCVVLGAKGSMANWVFGIIECFLYTYICLKGHIYGDALQRLFYTLPMQFVGWHMWHHRRRPDVKSQIKTRFMTWRQREFMLGVIAVFTFLFAFLLKDFGQSIQHFLSTYLLPGKFVKTGYSNDFQLYFDAFTTIVSIVAMFISTKAYVEQWLLWILVNIVSAAIWYQNLDSGDPHAFMTVSKYALYLINSFYGYFMWRRLARI